MKTEKILLDSDKVQFINNLFDKHLRLPKHTLLLELCKIARCTMDFANKKLNIAEREGYIVPCVDPGYELYFEKGAALA